MKAAIFDVGGVLILDHKLRRNAFAAFPEILPQTLFSTFTQCALPACRGEESLATAWRTTAQRLGVKLDDAVAEALWINDYSAGIEVNSELLQMVKEMRGRYKLGIVSNTIREHADILRSMGVYDDFDSVVLSHEHGITKDSSEIFNIALEELEVAPAEAAFIDDVPAFAKAATSKGIAGLVYESPARLRADLRELGFAIQA